MGTQDRRPDEDKPQAHGGERRAEEARTPADQTGAERYPSVRQDDSVEAPRPTAEDRSFEGESAERASRGDGEHAPDPSLHQGGMGGDGAPDEGKR